MVMPRSRSSSMLSRSCCFIARFSTVPVSSSRRSASVDLPWSTWAMMLKLRIRGGVGHVGVGVASGGVRASALARREGRTGANEAKHVRAGSPGRKAGSRFKSRSMSR